MKPLSQESLKNMKGGFSIWAGVGIGALVIFLSGIIDCIVHPKACEEK